jgi:3-hydroxyisobutyrate dehydrogenase-like beta-hydroxyacid dehydrogenase
MPRSKMTAPPLDPMDFANATLTWWRMMMLDMPMAYAAESSAFMERWAAHQAEFFQQLSGSTTLQEVADAQTKYMAKSVEDYTQSAKIISRDLTITLEAANA